MLLANDPPSMLVPKANQRDTNSIFYYYFYSVNVPNRLLMTIILAISRTEIILKNTISIPRLRIGY